MPDIVRHSVAKTQKSYDPGGLSKVLGSTVTSTTQEYTAGHPYVKDNNGVANGGNTPRLLPTS